jgi:hypothetical protein
VSNGQFCGQVLAVAVWGTPPANESLFKNWKVLLTPITSFATSGVNAVVVSDAAPTLTRIVTHFGGAQTGPPDEDDVLVLQALEAQ